MRLCEKVTTYLKEDNFVKSRNKNIAEGTRGPFYTTGRLSLPAADTLTRRRTYYYCKLIPEAQHRSCTMVYGVERRPVCLIITLSTLTFFSPWSGSACVSCVYVTATATATFSCHCGLSSGRASRTSSSPWIRTAPASSPSPCSRWPGSPCSPPPALCSPVHRPAQSKVFSLLAD